MEVRNGGYFEADINARFSMSRQQVQINPKDDAKNINTNLLMTQYTMEFQLEIKLTASGNFSAQSLSEGLEKTKEFLKGIDLSKIGYEGKNLDEMSEDEAKEAVSEDGFFGIKNTALRISDFVLIGGGEDIDRLKAGREGVLKGFNDAQSIWGDTLPDIAYKTLEEVLKRIDEKISKLGGQVLDFQA